MKVRGDRSSTAVYRTPNGLLSYPRARTNGRITSIAWSSARPTGPSRKISSPAKSPVSEDQANRFAGALLMPESELLAALPSAPTVRDFIGLKASWGMSVAALVYRFRNGLR